MSYMLLTTLKLCNFVFERGLKKASPTPDMEEEMDVMMYLPENWQT